MLHRREEERLSSANIDMTATLKEGLIRIIGLSKLRHGIDILKHNTVKEAHAYCKVNQLSGQVTGPLIENYIKTKYNMTKNNASLCIGDLHHNGKNMEIKASTGGKDNNKFNYVQLRMNHSCEYLLTAYYIDETNVENLGELYIFKIDKIGLRPIILKCGGYAHGTKEKLGPITLEDLEDETNDKEYAIRPTYGDKCWKELLAFRVDESSI